MTTEERFDRIEHITARIAEQRARDREEYKALWRSLAEKTESIARHVDALAIDVRNRFDQVADQFEATDRKLRELGEATDRKLRELGEATDARIAALTSAIGEHLRAGHPQQ